MEVSIIIPTFVSSTFLLIFLPSLLSPINILTPSPIPLAHKPLILVILLQLRCNSQNSPHLKCIHELLCVQLPRKHGHTKPLTLQSRIPPTMRQKSPSAVSQYLYLVCTGWPHHPPRSFPGVLLARPHPDWNLLEARIYWFKGLFKAHKNPRPLRSSLSAISFT